MKDVFWSICTSRTNYQQVVRLTIQFHVYSTGSDVTDHVPVDGNPAYTPMETIHLNKNSAYETATQLPPVNSSV